MRPGTGSVSALDDPRSSVPGEVVSGIQASNSLIKFQKEPPCRYAKAPAGRLYILEITMSVNANYCGTVLLLRQLVRDGYCTKNEATRIAALIARQTGVNIKLPIT